MSTLVLIFLLLLGVIVAIFLILFSLKNLRQGEIKYNSRKVTYVILIISSILLISAIGVLIWLIRALCVGCE